MRYTILDIETRIDKRLVRQVYHPDADLSDEDAYSQVRQQLKQDQGSDFFPISFHIPVSIAVGQVDEEHVLTAVETLAGEDADEETMVRTFWQRLDRFRGTLVTFKRPRLRPARPRTPGPQIRLSGSALLWRQGPLPFQPRRPLRPVRLCHQLRRPTSAGRSQSAGKNDRFTGQGRD